MKDLTELQSKLILWSKSRSDQGIHSKDLYLVFRRHRRKQKRAEILYQDLPPDGQEHVS